MHHSFRKAGRAGAVEPEAHVIATGIGWVECVGCGVRNLGEGELPGLGVPDYHKVAEMCELADPAKGIDEGCRYHGHFGAAVIQEVGIVLGFEVGVDGYRDRTQLDGAEKGGHELRAVKRSDQHPVLDLDAMLTERVPHPVRAGRDLSVRLLDTVGGANGDLVPPAGFQVAVQQVGTRVVAKRQFSGRPNAHADSLEVRPEAQPRDLGLRWSRSKEPPSTGLSVFEIRAGRSAEGNAGDGLHKAQRSGWAFGRTSKVGRGVWKVTPADLRWDLRFLNSLRAARNRARAGRPCVGGPQPAAWAYRAVRSEP